MGNYDDRYSGGESRTSRHRKETRAVHADDGRELHAVWFRPVGESRGAVVVVGAMATPAVFYAPIAAWLADRGFLVLTFDFRGTGDAGAMRAEHGDLLRWAGDAASALEALVAAMPAGLPVTWVGHSLGGQLLPFARHDLLDRGLLIASGLTYWRGVHPSLRRWTPLLLRVIAPVTIKAAGYFPGRSMGILGDVPPNVMRQWVRWCLHDHYMEIDVPDIRLRASQLTTPLSALMISDDELLGDASLVALTELYDSAAIDIARLRPRDLGVERIGHHGFFRRGMQPAWETEVLPRLASY